MPGAVNTNATSSDLTTTLTNINSARTKFGLGTLTLTNTAAGNPILSSHIDSMKTALQQVITQSGAPYNVNGVINYAVGNKVIPGVLQTLHDTAVNVYNYCSCNCNNCGCNYCTCNCDNCGCDYCTCNCNYCYCSCDCNDCGCNYCTCDCNHSSCSYHCPSNYT